MTHFQSKLELCCQDVAMAPCLLLRLHGDPMITGSLAPRIFLYKTSCGVGGGGATVDG